MDRKERSIYRLFEIGIVLKGVNAAVELVLGFLFLFVNVGALVQALIQNELIEDPDSFLATHLQGAAARITPGAELYSALYLLSHGVIKMILVVGLMRKQAWAYPASLAVLALFVVYQTIQFLGNHSIALLALDIFDLGFMWLIWHEYRRSLRAGK